MSNGFNESRSILRDDSIQCVDAILQDYGFRRLPDGGWIGRVPPGASGTEVRLDFPPSFPDQIPEIRLLNPPQTWLPHVEASGKLCLAPASGILIDTDRPIDIVGECLDRAATILRRTDAEYFRREMSLEYSAYWGGESIVIALSVVRPSRNLSGPLIAAALAGDRCSAVLAPDDASLHAWLDAFGFDDADRANAYFVKLTSLPDPPSPRGSLSLRGFLKLVETCGSKEEASALTGWLKEQALPAIVLLWSPVHADELGVMFAVRIEPVSGEASRIAQRGFRPGKAPRTKQIAAAQSEPVTRLTVERADPEFLAARTSGNRMSLERTVGVIGCGALGSALSVAIAASGIGRLILIDNERLEAVALGDETLERRLNKYWGSRIPRVHVWVEGMGLGGHLLSTGFPGQPGCYECLFSRDTAQCLVNLASFSAPNQKLQRNVGGCSGTFTPFGFLDAQRAGGEAAQEVIGILCNPESVPKLRSWLIDPEGFNSRGFSLSRRARNLKPGELTTDFARPDCPVCGSRSW